MTEQRRKWALRAIAVAAGVGIYVAFNQLVDIEKLLEDVANALGAWTYLLVGVFAFAETGAFVGLVVPGETVMLLGGAVAGQGATNIYLLIAIAWFFAFAGDSTSFFVGRRLGRGFLMRHGPRFGLGPERLERIEDYFDRHGGKTIFLGRFVGFVRAFAPFIAGSSGMGYRRFVPYSILGTGLWVSSALAIGYVFSRNIGTALDYAGKGAFALGTLIVLVVGAVALYRYLRVAENRRKVVRWMEGRRATAWIVALARRFSPQLRFFWNRVTPGGTFGLEFTTLMAVLAVASFVLISYTVIVGEDPGPTPGDMTAAEIAENLRTDWLVDIAKAVSVLGSASLVLPLALICAALLALGGRWAEVAVLVAGLAIAIAGAHELKAAVDRPRPRVGLTALIGLSRVYLDVHYLSDVNAGWALGASAFSVCAAVALIVTTVRHNGFDVAAAGATEDRR
jgi:undecaprenyl-diphosphatase